MLVVEEIEDNQNTINSIFHDDYKIINTSNETEASEIITKSDIDVVLADLHFISQLSPNKKFNEIPLIAMTDKDNFDDGAAAIKAGAFEFITRPYNQTVVHYRIQNVIKHFADLRDINAAKEKQLSKMHRYIENDLLTGLYNRESFYKRAAAMMQEHPETKYYIIYLDISCFKAINDLFQIETGNLILRTTASYLKVLIKPDIGICSRIEADHFVVCAPQDNIDIEKLIIGLDNIIQSLGISHNILFYAGIYPVSNPSLPVDQMCDRANMALRKIKGNYMNRYAYYDSGMRELMLQDQMIVRDMESALQEEQFTIFLQPIYNIRKNMIESAEALVRWFHPVNGMISPGKFIPVFERNGFIVKVDRFVWESVCKFIQKQRSETGDIIPVSVNVSRMNFYNLDLLEFLLGLLEKYELEPWMLKLEITESAYTDNPHQLMSIIRVFREEGFPVLMDDFGSGYSSLNMLKNLPVDVLKVDMAFVRELEESERAYMILKFIMRLAHDLGMDVVIEGVETQKQLDYLANLGADKIQGYFFSRPLPVPDFKKLLAETNYK
ncbi:MAG: GGDEF domain-containing response regulator [Selenomonadaceae bacterium]|nr:GGDEF domain-containing response regulator [Selenomonadaceae bacterium]